MAKAIVAPRSFAGYIQSKGTSEGFQRMRRRGIVLPPFQIEQSAAKMVRIEFEAMIADFKKHLVIASAQTGIGVQDAENELVSETIDRIRSQLATLNSQGLLDEDETRIRIQLSRQLAEAQEHFFADFFTDASERMKTAIAFSLDKNDVFRDRLAGIRKGYLDTAIERISDGRSTLRKKFIGVLEQWVAGEREDLEGLDGLMDKIQGEGVTFSKFFARDQFSRFNKSMMVASYDEAGAKWIRWCTVGDQRVRRTHRALNGKIFAIDDMPDEYLDYLCRCGFLPVFELGTRQVTRGDGIALAA